MRYAEVWENERVRKYPQLQLHAFFNGAGEKVKWGLARGFTIKRDVLTVLVMIGISAGAGA